MKQVLVRFFRSHYSRLVLATLISSGIATSIAAARPWNPSKRDMAQEYLQIIHARSQNNIAMLWWIAPPMMTGPNTEIAKEVLDKYVLVAVVSARISAEGNWSFPATGTPRVADGSGKPLKLLTGDNLPPSVQGMVVALQGTLRQGIGAMGEGMQFFTFEAGNVRACQKGGLSVVYDKEKYTWDTPIPGC